jgi:hypothetical protein
VLGFVDAVAVSDDHSLLLTGDRNGELYAWDPRSRNWSDRAVPERRDHGRTGPCRRDQSGRSGSPNLTAHRRYRGVFGGRFQST